MEIFGNASHINHQQNAGMVRHSVHSFAHTSRNVSQSVSTDFQAISASSPKKPALPPKENRKTIASMLTSSAHTPPQSPKMFNDHMMIESCIQEDQEECTTPLVDEFPIDEMDNMVVLRSKAKSIEDVSRKKVRIHVEIESL